MSLAVRRFCYSKPNVPGQSIQWHYSLVHHSVQWRTHGRQMSHACSQGTDTRWWESSTYCVFAPSRWKTCFNHLLAKDDGVEMPLSTGHTSIVSCPGTHIRLVLGIGDMPQGPDRHTGVSPVSLTDRTCLDDSLLSNTRPSRTLSSRVGGMPHIKDMARWFHCATRPNRALGLFASKACLKRPIAIQGRFRFACARQDMPRRHYYKSPRALQCLV